MAVTFAAAVVVLGLSACGSESRVRTRPAPRLSRAVATSLAARSDALAAVLRRGDACAAKIQMHGLERQTRLALAAGRVPVALRARLLPAERQLAARLPRCAPPPPPPPPPPAPPPPPVTKHGKHEDHGHGHGKGHGKHGNGEGD